MKTSIDTKNLAGATSELFVMMFGAPLAFFTSFAAGPEVRIEPARPRLELASTCNNCNRRFRFGASFDLASLDRFAKVAAS
jgi:hypothetical protein